MADVKISELTAFTTLDGTETLVAVQGGVTKKGAVSLVRTLPLSATTAVTTADIAAAVNTWYHLDISGLTAARSVLLPAGVAGDRIRVSLSVGDASYELNIKGDTGISINGGTAAALFTCLVDKGEWIEFVATSTSNWQVGEDGRKSLAWRVQNDDSTTQNISTATLTTLTTALGQWVFGPSQWYSAGVFTPKRPGRWMFGTAAYVIGGSWADNGNFAGAVYKNDASDDSIGMGGMYLNATVATNRAVGLSPAGVMSLNGSTDNARVKVYQSSGATQTNAASDRQCNFWGVWLGDN